MAARRPPQAAAGRTKKNTLRFQHNTGSIWPDHFHNQLSKLAVVGRVRPGRRGSEGREGQVTRMAARRPPPDERGLLSDPTSDQRDLDSNFFLFFLSITGRLPLPWQRGLSISYRIVSYRIGSYWIGLIRHHENRGGGEHDPLSAHRYAHAYQRAGSGRGR